MKTAAFCCRLGFRSLVGVVNVNSTNCLLFSPACRWIWIRLSVLGRHQRFCQGLHPPADVCRCQQALYLPRSPPTSMVIIFLTKKPKWNCLLHLVANPRPELLHLPMFSHSVLRNCPGINVAPLVLVNAGYLAMPPAPRTSTVPCRNNWKRISPSLDGGYVHLSQICLHFSFSFFFEFFGIFYYSSSLILTGSAAPLSFRLYIFPCSSFSDSYSSLSSSGLSFSLWLSRPRFPYRHLKYSDCN